MCYDILLNNALDFNANTGKKILSDRPQGSGAGGTSMMYANCGILYYLYESSMKGE